MFIIHNTSRTFIGTDKEISLLKEREKEREKQKQTNKLNQSISATILFGSHCWQTLGIKNAIVADTFLQSWIVSTKDFLCFTVRPPTELLVCVVSGVSY